MATKQNIYSVTGLKRNAENKWTLFENVTSLSEIANTLATENFDFAVIYDEHKKYKLGSWTNSKGVKFFRNKRKVLK